METRKFTGWHMAAIIVAFFAVVIGVNLVMARYAVSTFGGTVVDNSYVASQKYNRWLAEAEAQRDAGWNARIGLDQARHVTIALTYPANLPSRLKLTANADHVLGRASSMALEFRRSADGGWISEHPLPIGRWHVRIKAAQANNIARFRGTLG